MTQGVFERVRRRDRRRRVLVVLLPVLVVLAAAALVWVVWFSSLLAAESVTVEGLETLPPEKVEETAQVPVGRPLARLDVMAVEGRVGAMERVESVRVERSWPSTVRVVVKEREAVGWVVSDGRIRVVDRFGIDFRTLERRPDQLVEIRLPSMEARQRQQSLASAAAVVHFLSTNDPALLGDVRHVDVASRDSVVLALSDDRTVTWGSAARSADKLSILASMLEAVPAAGYDVSAPEQPTTRD